MIDRRTLVGAGLSAPFLLGGLKGARAQDGGPLKIAFMYVGPIGDLGWSYQHDQGRLAVEKEFGDKVQTSYVESVPEGADAERVLRQMAQAGNKLVFATSFGFMQAALNVAKQFPDTVFEHCTGFKTAQNLGVYNARFYEGRYVSGVLAGRMSQAKTIGYIGSFPIPEVVMGINAYTLGAQKVMPDVSTKVVWVNSWYDPGKEAEAANALIDQGCDFIVQHTDSPAPVQAAEKRGVWCVGQASDMGRFGPERCLTSVVDDWATYYIKTAREVMEGSWASTVYWGGMAEGSVVMTPWNQNVPADVQAELDELVAGIKAKTVHPFQGPVKNQAGEVVIPEGSVISDADLLQMMYYVEGVDSTLPG
ncbi:BMP family ABC transporter substrate-binding protein [Geminicoccus roseus]|uniref:BMP family ABC transporter substrate-binding protein n=1 Tax=Geminicoccus roseus TaxID=404900 RepID=UPI0004202157|nr:BMP family ABC transporter substrate-binding protein [Geminicoccus roseus]